MANIPAGLLSQPYENLLTRNGCPRSDLSAALTRMGDKHHRQKPVPSLTFLQLRNH